LLKLDNHEWFVDDRTEFTIGYRLKDCQKLGIPIVIAFGKRAVRFILYKLLFIYLFRLNKTCVKSLMYTRIKQHIYPMKTHYSLYMIIIQFFVRHYFFF
jgi:hypothetical protein